MHDGRRKGRKINEKTTYYKTDNGWNSEAVAREREREERGVSRLKKKTHREHEKEKHNDENRNPKERLRKHMRGKENKNIVQLKN